MVLLPQVPVTCNSLNKKNMLSKAPFMEIKVELDKFQQCTMLKIIVWKYHDSSLEKE